MVALIGFGEHADKEQLPYRMTGLPAISPANTSQLLYRMPGLSAISPANTAWSHRNSCTDCLDSLPSENNLVTSQLLYRMPCLSVIRTQTGHIAVPVQNAWTLCHQNTTWSHCSSCTECLDCLPSAQPTQPGQIAANVVLMSVQLRHVVTTL